MQQTIFVISDLHLGGEPATKDRPSFQMCSAEGQVLLADFLRWVASQSAPAGIRLVVAGDIVDFLAETDGKGQFSAFTSDQISARAKFKKIRDRTSPIWKGFANVVKAGHALTLMLGNHDIELSLPIVRGDLLNELGPGRIDLLFDNEAFVMGDLLIEHGNRYEGFNVVAYNSLRQTRSLLSRRETPPVFPVQPGSELVQGVMNPIKLKFAFVDLLKPETAAVMPILAVLDPPKWIIAGKAIKDAAQAAWRQRQYDRQGRPTDPNFAAATTKKAATSPTESELAVTSSSRAAGQPPRGEDQFPGVEHFELAQQLAGEALGQKANEVGFLEIKESVSEAIGRLKKDLLLRALRSWGDSDRRTFDVAQESPTYLVPATNLAKNNKFKVIVNGHTHLAKQFAIAETGATYLNTGTWADLMRIPPAILADDRAAAESALGEFLEDLKNNRLERYRRPVPTFAKIELDDDKIASAGVFFFDGPDKIEGLTTDGLLKRLEISQ